MNANTPNMNASTFIAIRTTNIYLRKLVLRVRLHTLFAATAVRVRSHFLYITITGHIQCLYSLSSSDHHALGRNIPLLIPQLTAIYFSSTFY